MIVRGPEENYGSETDLTFQRLSEQPAAFSENQFELPRGLYHTDSFHDRYSAYHNPQPVTPADDIQESNRPFEERLQGLLLEAALEYADHAPQAHVGPFQKGKNGGMQRIIELKDKDGGFYLPPVAELNQGASSGTRAERFEHGEARIVQRLVAFRRSAEELEVSNKFDAYFDRAGFMEAVRHMRDSFLQEQNSPDGDNRRSYSYLRAEMSNQILESASELDSDQQEKLFGDHKQSSLHLLKLRTKPLPDGMIMSFSLASDSSDGTLDVSYRLTLNHVGKLTVEPLQTRVK